jgi:hypothetical protein
MVGIPYVHHCPVVEEFDTDATQPIRRRTPFCPGHDPPVGAAVRQYRGVVAIGCPPSLGYLQSGHHFTDGLARPVAIDDPRDILVENQANLGVGPNRCTCGDVAPSDMGTWLKYVALKNVAKRPVPDAKTVLGGAGGELHLPAGKSIAVCEEAVEDSKL